MGILILSGAYNTGELFKNNGFIRYLLGGILVIYGIFRAHNAYMKLKQGTRKLRYYDSEEE
jgi:hypothetical protein